MVRRVSDLLDLAEYKRRQAPPGVKITRKAFGRDRRYPITNAFRKCAGRRSSEPPPIARWPAQRTVETGREPRST